MFNHCRNQMNRNRSQNRIRFHSLQHQLRLEPSLQQLVLFQLLFFQGQQLGRQLEQPLLWRLLELQQLYRRPLEPQRLEPLAFQLSFLLLQPPLAWLGQRQPLQIQRLQRRLLNLLLLQHLQQGRQLFQNPLLPFVQHQDDHQLVLLKFQIHYELCLNVNDHNLLVLVQHQTSDDFQIHLLKFFLAYHKSIDHRFLVGMEMFYLLLKLHFSYLHQLIL